MADHLNNHIYNCNYFNDRTKISDLKVNNEN